MLVSSTSQIAIQKINHAKENNLKQLNLSSNSLVQIPKEIFELHQLEVIDLSYNRIKVIPESLSGLTKLKRIILHENPIQKIADIFGLDLDYKTFNKFENSLTTSNIIGIKIASKIELDSFQFDNHTNLTSLDLSRNKLTELPIEIVKLTKLASLNLNGNKLTVLPKEIVKLKNLTSLYQGSNKLTELPKEIVKLINLKSLDISYNNLTELPKEIAKLTNLKSLFLSENKLAELPKEIAKLTNLKSLYLDSNNLSELPNEIIKLTILSSLDLGSNNLTEVPKEIVKLNSLTSLDLSFNSVIELSKEIVELTKLKSLDLSGNPLETPPVAIAVNGIDAIRDYFRQIETEGVDYIYEAKLLLVGQGGTGKTTLANKIINENYQLEDNLGTTKGIDIINWHFDLPNGKKFQVNIWDFGGQQIYHATHQFFLTKSSLYALVADSRKEDSKIFYWLDIVKMLSGNSPLLIVKNEIEDREVEIDDKKIRKLFDNLIDSFPTNLKTNRNFDKIKECIKYNIQNLDHVKTTLPKTWKKIRDILEKDKRDYISLDQYFKICKDNEFTQEKDNLQLSDYLHTLGVCLHFQNDPALKQTVILSPTWGTDAVYKVLDNKEVIESKGRFSLSHLEQIWHEDKYCNKHYELLRLMINFKICYEIPNKKNNYIAPQLLEKTQPTYCWDEPDNLSMHYDYEFMPKGILTRFIVKMHEFITNQKLVWRTGVVIENDNSKAEVIEHYEQSKIEIRVNGQNKKEWITNIIFVIDYIHRSYPGLKFDKMIPCNCNKCHNNPNPTFYPYETLKKFRADKRDIQCTKSYEMMDVFRLIDDIIIEENIDGKTSKENERPNIQIKGDYVVTERYKKEQKNKETNIGDGNTINAPIVIAESIENSFNLLKGSNTNGELKELLESLLTEILKLQTTNPSEDILNMNQDAESLVIESIKDNPRTHSVKHLLENLKESATTITATNSAAIVIIDTINNISAFFGL